MPRRILELVECEQEGAGVAVLTASVEVVFDNADNRLPVRRDLYMCM